MPDLNRKHGYTLQRKAIADIGRIIGARFPSSPNADYDLESANGERIEIRSTYVKPLTNYARWSLTHLRDNIPFRKRVDYLISVAYYLENNVLAIILCIPAKDLPEWETTFAISLRPKVIRRRYTWRQHILTKEQLAEKFAEKK